MPYVDATIPMRGTTQDAPWSGLPMGFTPDALNVLPMDPFRSKLRIGQRPAVAVAYEFLDDDDDPMPIQAITNAEAYVTGGTLTSRCVVVAGGLVYVIDPGAAAVLCGNQESMGDLDPQMSTDGLIQCVAFGGFVYFVDGADYWKINLTASVPDLTAWAGPEGVVEAGSSKATLLVRFGTRLALSGLSESPNNWFLSAVGDPEDWVPGVNPGNPVAGDSDNRFGLVGAPIVALIPVGESGLIFAQATSMTYLTADPVVPGVRLVELSRAIGVAGPKAWAVVDSQTVYLLADSGLFRFNPNAFSVTEQNRVTGGRYDSYFRSQNFAELDPVLQWDSEQSICWVFLSEPDNDPRVHLAYHQLTDSFWPVAIALPSMYSPKCAGLVPSTTVEPPHAAIGGVGIVAWFGRQTVSGVDGVQAAGLESVGGTTGPTDEEAEAQRVVSRLTIGPILTQLPLDAMLKDIRVDLGTEEAQDDPDWSSFLSGPSLLVISGDTAQDALGANILSLLTEEPPINHSDTDNDADGGDAAGGSDFDCDGGDANDVMASDLDGGYCVHLPNLTLASTDSLASEPTSRTYAYGPIRARYVSGAWRLEYSPTTTPLAIKTAYWDQDAPTLPRGLYAHEDVVGALDPMDPFNFTFVYVDNAPFGSQSETELEDLLPGRNDARRCRVRAGAAYAVIRSLGKPWSLERMSALVEQVGPHRGTRSAY